MDIMNLMLWVISGGFTIMFTLMLIIWNSINHKIEKLDEKVTDIDRRLCRLEGAFSSKECCILKEDKYQKTAE